LLTDFFPSLTRAGSTALLYDLDNFTGITLCYLFIPLTIGVAVLRYRLWEIDVLINRALVYGALTASVIGLYVLLVGGLGALLQARGNLPISLLATGLIAVLFAPMRERFQRGVNRLMYGERDDPYKVLSQLGQRLEATLEPESVLPAVAQTVAQALKLPYAAIMLKEEGEGREGFAVAAAYGSPVGSPIRLPLVYQHEAVGQLVLAPRLGEEGFSPTDRRLLDDLARQAGTAAYAVLLTADLRRTRERLVAAREVERRRLRRDLHDGLGPQLSSQTLTIDAVRALMRQDPDTAEALLLDLKQQAQVAVADIRRLVYALRPPALDDHGLVGVLRETAAQYGQNGLVVSVNVPEPLQPLPAAVEVAAYRIALEAMTNVARRRAWR
jgi:signal transduction histidine kinase